MVDEEQIVKSHKTLKSRYSNEKLLQSAALRRAHLNYNKISFGKNLNAKKKYLRLLLSQAHTAYYLGSFHACVAICGSLLEALLQTKIRKELREKGKIDFYYYFQGKKKNCIDTLEDLDRITFNDMINLSKHNKYFSIESFTDLCNIKEIRNQALHSRLSPFVQTKDNYLLNIERINKKITVTLEKSEVDELKDDGFQITSYYCISRMRNIFKELIE